MVRSVAEGAAAARVGAVVASATPETITAMPAHTQLSMGSGRGRTPPTRAGEVAFSYAG